MCTPTQSNIFHNLLRFSAQTQELVPLLPFRKSWIRHWLLFMRIYQGYFLSDIVALSETMHTTDTEFSVTNLFYLHLSD